LAGKNPDKSWNQEQTDAYQKYLTDLQLYIHQYIFTTKQVTDYTVYQTAMADYTNVNPLGKSLYERQSDYFEKKSTGYDFKHEKELQKQRNKEENKKLQLLKLLKKEEKPKEEELQPRKDDPIVTAT
jgi:hypothetical protein